VADARADIPRPAGGTAQDPAAERPASGPAGSARILVVDDDPFVARTLVDLLGLNGFGGTRADSGEQALEMLAAREYDLVLLDVRLPGISGYDTCARVRELYGPGLPVILLTAFGDATSIRRGYEVGADDFLNKPVDTSQLVLKVKAFLRLKTLHDEIDRARREAQARARDLALLHDLGRDWSLIAEPEEFHRLVTGRLAGLIGAPICMLALYDPVTRTMAAALPVHGMPDEPARELRYVVKPEYRSLWNFRTGRAYMSNRARNDPRLLQDIVQQLDAESVVLVPMISEGEVLGLVAAVNKPGGFTDSDVQLLSIFAGPAASFLRSRKAYTQQRRHAERLERMAALVGDMAGVGSRAALLDLTVDRIRRDLGYERVAFHGAGPGGDDFQVEAEVGERPGHLPLDRALLRWALRGSAPLQATHGTAASELAVPVRAGDHALGVLEIVRARAAAFEEEEVNLLSALAGQIAVALQKAESGAETERLARQMGILYDLALETSPLRDLRPLFTKAAEEAGRLIDADHTSVLRWEPALGGLKLFAAWARDHSQETYASPVFRMGEGIAGSVAQDRIPALVNEPGQHPAFVARANPVSRLICMPLTYFDRESEEGSALFGVLNATRKPGAKPFTEEDLEYLTRFASQLSIAVANSMAYAAERERSDQLSMVNALIRAIGGTLSRQGIFDTAVRRIQEAFRYPVVAISVAEDDHHAYRLVASVSREPKLRTENGRFSVDAGVVGRAYREKRTQNVPDVSLDGDYVSLVASTRSEVAIPIFSGDEVVAVLNVESDHPAAFKRTDVITLETLADSLGIMLRNAELYQALEETNAKLVEIDRMKSELVNIVAHDFRAPLAGVLGHAELLEWRPDANRSDRIEQARAIIHAATHMANLVEKTLKTTRLETGQFPFEFGVMDLVAVTRDVVARLPGRPNHPLTVDLPEDPVPCWADRDRIAEVLDNLVSNAVKYSPAGGPVHLDVRRDGETAVVRVSDQGIGIANEDLHRLFRPFSRVRTVRTAQIEGSGLGLYICDRIVRAHGGRLFVDTSPERGSVFSFALPLFGAAAQMRPPVILVAVADERTRREIRRVSEEQGYAVHDATDGVEAVEAALRLVPAAIILDRVLPRLRAEEVADRLRSSPATEGVPLYLLGSATDLSGRAEAFDGFIPKPLEKQALSQILGSLQGLRPPLTSPPPGA
jgi:signal transduction histidine kinase/DNA-binding response OmpR family regulator